MSAPAGTVFQIHVVTWRCDHCGQFGTGTLNLDQELIDIGVDVEHEKKATEQAFVSAHVEESPECAVSQ